MSLFIHIANIIYLGSYAVRDMLWLRCLTFCALCLGVSYFASRPEPLLAPILWQSVSAAINLGQIIRISRQRVSRIEAEPNPEDVFEHLSRSEMIALLARASWGSNAR